MRWTIVSAREFADHAPAWQALSERGPRTPLLDARFVAASLENFGTRNALLAIHGDPGAPAAMALLVPRGLGRYETFQPSQAPLGTWVSDAAHPPSEELLAGLIRRLPGLALSCGITQVDPDLVPRPPGSSRLRTLDYIRTARITVQGTFEQYWAARGSNLRKNMKRRRRRIEEEGITPRLEILTDAGSMALAVADYGRLESAGWKAGTGTAIHGENAQGRFYTRVLTDFASRGEAIVYRYWYGDRLAASDLCIHRDGTIIILKTTYDEALAESSPAFLMRQESFAGIFGSGRFRRIEFYGKVMDWHTKWSDEIRTMYHVTAYRWSVVPRIFARARPDRAVVEPEPATPAV